MDEHVLRGLAKWPNVPAIYGWLALDRRGNWLLRGEPIANATVNAYISRNYERDAEGRWFFQNGPQRVYVSLEYTPFVYRVLGANGGLRLETHTQQEVTAVSGAWVDETGALLLETEYGVGVVHDRDLELTLPALVDDQGNALSEHALDEAMAVLAEGRAAPVWLAIGVSNVCIDPIASTDVPRRFGFVAQPSDPAAP